MTLASQDSKKENTNNRNSNRDSSLAVHETVVSAERGKIFLLIALIALIHWQKSAKSLKES